VLQQWLVDRVRALSATGPYRPPDTAERDRAVAALGAVLAGREPDLGGLPLHLHRGTDRTGLPFTMITDSDTDSDSDSGSGRSTGTGWGAVVLREAPELVVEVPHPGSDRHTARLGLALFHAVPGAALLVAGAHRRAGGGAADVAHRGDSLFHAFADALALPEIQLHGFAEDSAPDTDAVVSPGAGEPAELHRHVEKALARQGFRVRHHERLAGRTNVQGIAAAARGTPFLHLELAPLLRLHHRDRLVEAIAHAWHQQRH
jgi:hypothetical protein